MENHERDVSWCQAQLYDPRSIFGVLLSHTGDEALKSSRAAQELPACAADAAALRLAAAEHNSACGWALLAEDLMEKVLLALQTSLQRPNQQPEEGVGFSKALAVVRLVCLGWSSRYGVLVRWVRLMQPNLPLALCYPIVTMDAVFNTVVRRFPAAASMEVKWAPRRGRHQTYARANQGRLTDKGVQAISKLPALTALKLDHSDRITNQGLRALSGVSHLKALKLAHGYKLTDEAVRGWSAAALTSLNLSFCVNITAVGMRAVSCMSTLTSLDLQFCVNVSDEAVRAVSRMSTLTELNLSQCSITVEGVRYVSGMSSLKVLKLQGGVKVTDEAMIAVSRMPALMSLDLTGNLNITDVGIRAVSSVSSLTFLDLSLCMYITDQAAWAMSSMDALTSLNLTHCVRITDEAVRALSAMPALAYLNLSECREVTDAGVRAACASMSANSSLILVGCCDVTAATVQHLRAAHPHIRIVKGWRPSRCPLDDWLI
jgi:hypothetical protein